MLIVGVTIVGAKSLIDSDGEIDDHAPDFVHVDPTPGRETARFVPIVSDDAHQAARDDLEEALA